MIEVVRDGVDRRTLGISCYGDGGRDLLRALLLVVVTNEE
jgi:hypothetical protein